MTSMYKDNIALRSNPKFRGTKKKWIHERLGVNPQSIANPVLNVKKSLNMHASHVHNELIRGKQALFGAHVTTQTREKNSVMRCHHAQDALMHDDRRQ